jgi:hypothetical protein
MTFGCSVVAEIYHLSDNYCVLLQYFTRQFGVDASDIHKEFGIPENYEDIA